MDLQSLYLTSGIIGVVIIIPGAVIGLRRDWFESPRRRAARASEEEFRARSKMVADAILGEPAELDLAGDVISPKRPGLVARTTTLELAVATWTDNGHQIRELRAEQADLRAEQAELKGRLEGIDAAIGLLTGDKFQSGSEAQLKIEELKQRDVLDVDPES